MLRLPSRAWPSRSPGAPRRSTSARWLPGAPFPQLPIRRRKLPALRRSRRRLSLASTGQFQRRCATTASFPTRCVAAEGR